MSQSNAGSETSPVTQSANSNADTQNSGVVDIATLSRPPRNQRASVAKHSDDASESADDKPLSIADIFKDSDDDAGESSVESEEDAKKPVDSIDRLIKRTGLTAEQAYAIKIPMPNGQEPVTIGELKDRHAELADLDTRELQFEQHRTRAEGDLLRTQNEVRELLNLIPREHVTNEMVAKVRKQHEAVQTRERALTLNIIPSWQDEDSRLKDITGITKWLSEDYGFSDNFLSTVVDHRALKFIRDQYVRNEKIKAALARVTTPLKNGQRPSGKPAKLPTKPNSKQSTSTRRTGAVPTERDRIMNLFNKPE